MAKHTLVNRIDTAFVDQHPERDKPFRSHLGGSLIGRKCERELFYSFHWFRRPTFDGRMLRLFDRGHKEEFRFVAFLRSIGLDVMEYAQRLCLDDGTYRTLDWDADFSSSGLVDVTGDEEHHKRAKGQGVEVKQWGISDVMGHFGGSLDGIATAPFPIEITEFDLPNAQLVMTGRFIPAGERFLNEFKTHGTKSFVKLVNEGVKTAKPEHYAQMQTYMHKKGLLFGLYMAVNKNDDDLWIEVIDLDPEFGPKMVEKARKIIHTRKPPNRIAKDATWYECKFCDYRRICHYGETAEIDRNCRSCEHAVPVDDGQWHCSHWNSIIPKEALLAGCPKHKIITD